MLGLRSVSYWDFGSMNGAIWSIIWMNKTGDKEIWRASASLKRGLESHPLDAWFFLTSSIEGCPKKMGTLLRGCLRCCASGGNHLTFKLCLCSFGQTSRPMMGFALNLASQEDQFFHLQHLIKNNCAITLLKNPWNSGKRSHFFKVLSLELPWSSSILLLHRGDVLGLNSLLSRCDWQSSADALMRPGHLGSLWNTHVDLEADLERKTPPPKKKL